MSEPKKNIRIGDILVNDGYITDAQLGEALAYQKVDRSKRLGAILVDSGQGLVSFTPTSWRRCPVVPRGLFRSPRPRS